MTGVQSAQILGPTTQKQADASRQAIEGVDDEEFSSTPSEGSSGGFGVGETDGGRSEVEQNNGIDVVR
jgi:cell division protein FtsZ